MHQSEGNITDDAPMVGELMMWSIDASVMETPISAILVQISR